MQFSKNVHFIIPMLGLFITLIIPTCKEAPSEAPEIITKITGKVTDKETNKPISGAQVTTNPSSSSVNTGSDGNYTIPDLNPGQYTLTAKKEGYNDNITTVTVQEGKTVTADIQLTKASPELNVSPNILDFETSKSSLNFFITNKLQVGTVTWKITTDQAWLSISPTEGTTSTETDPIQVTVNRNNIIAGNYTATIVVTSDAGSANVNVLMTKSNPSAPQLTVTPSFIDFGESLVSSQVEIKNTGTGLLTWSASINGSWINISNSNGTIQGGSSVIENVIIDKGGLSPNSYNGSILFNSDGGNQTINISMIVPQGTLNPPALQVNGSTTSNSIPLAWTKNTDSQFSSYKIYRSLTPGVTENSVLVTTLFNSNDNFYTDNNLQSGTTYYYRVFVYSSSGVGSGSNEISATTKKVLGSWASTEKIPDIFSNYITPNSLFPISENEVWLVFKNEIWLFNGTTWQQHVVLPSNESGSFNAIFAVSQNNIWAVGSYTLIYKYNGISWSKVESTEFRQNSTLYDIVGLSENDIWISSDGGELYHFDGNSWKLFSISAYNIVDLDINTTDNSDIWCLDDAGKVFNYNGTGWVFIDDLVDSYNNFNRIQVLSNTDIWISNGRFITSSGLFHYDGTTFDPKYKLQSGSSYPSRITVEMVSSNEGWSAFGDKSMLSYYDGNEWQDVTIPISNEVNCIKMLNSNSGWAVSEYGEILRYQK